MDRPEQTPKTFPLTKPSIDYFYSLFTLDELLNDFEAALPEASDFTNRVELFNNLREACTYYMLNENFNSVLQSYQKIRECVDNYSWKKVHTFSWLTEKNLHNPESTSILSDLAEILFEMGWTVLQKAFLEIQCLDDVSEETKREYANKVNKILVYLIHALKLYSEVNMDMARHLMSKFEFSFILVEDYKLLPEKITEYLDNIESLVLLFYSRLVEQNIQISPKDISTFYQFDRMVFWCNVLKAKIEIKRENLDQAEIFFEKCEKFKNGYNPIERVIKADCRGIKNGIAQLRVKQNNAKTLAEETLNLEENTEKLKGKVIKKTKKKKNKPSLLEFKPIDLIDSSPNSTVSANYSVGSVLKSNVRSLTVSERLPGCYQEPFFYDLLNLIAKNFQAIELLAFLFGGANSKRSPSDFDIFIPNINCNSESDWQKVEKLLKLFETQGGEILKDKKTNSPGYKKDNRYVIPIQIKKFKVDLIVSEKEPIEHAYTLDYTVGAVYFNLLELKMYHVEAFNSFKDIDNKVLNTIIDPLESFAHDPSRILRGVRVISKENFSFTLRCIEAIHSLFAEDKNPFFLMNRDKIFQQLELLCQRDALKNIEILHQLGLFDKLVQILEASTSKYYLVVKYLSFFRLYHSLHMLTKFVPDYKPEALSLEMNGLGEEKTQACSYCRFFPSLLSKKNSEDTVPAICYS